MAVDPAAGDIFRVSFPMSLLGQKLLCTSHFRINSLGGSFPTMDVFTADVFAKLDAANEVIAKFRACIPTNCFHDATWIQRIAPVRTRKRVFGISTNGTGFGTAETANVQGSVERYDDDARKWSVGAMHPPLAPIPTTVMVSGSLTAAPLAALNALAAKLYGTLVTAGGATIQWVLYHKAPKPGFLNYSNLVGAFAQTTVRVMRRRTVGVGK